MKVAIPFFIFYFLISKVDAQTNNNGLDTLKKDIRNIGNLFKKASVITFNINGIDSTNSNLSQLKKNIQQTINVKKVEAVYRENVAVLNILYKGKATDLWNALPLSTRQFYDVISLNDSLLKLNYKYATAKTASTNNLTTNANDSIFTTLKPDYVLKRIFKPSKQNAQGFYGWKPGKNDKIDSSSISDDGYYYTKFDTSLAFKDSAENKLLFFYTAVYQQGQLMDCHACSVLMSCISFEKESNGSYHLKSIKKDFTYSTAWGKPDDVALAKIGANKFAVTVSSYDMHQGYEQDFVTYFRADNFKQIYSTQVLDDNSGENPEHAHSTQTVIKFLPSTTGDYYLLQLITSGTIENEAGKIKPINKKEIYYFDMNNNEYVLQLKTPGK